MREFAIPYDALLKTPIKRFWFLNRQVDRLRAEDDLRRMKVLVAVNSNESFQQALDGFTKQMGTIAVFEEKTRELVNDPETGLDPEFDRAGLHALKAKL